MSRMTRKQIYLGEEVARSPEGPVDASANHDFYLYGAPWRQR